LYKVWFLLEATALWGDKTINNLGLQE
jgi:hypothetical protein